MKLLVFIFILLIIFLLSILIININNIYEEKFSNNSNKQVVKIKVAVLVAGFAPRSIKYTYKTIEDNIINHLKKNNFDVDIFMFSLLSKNNKLDSHRNEEKNNKYINNNDIKLLKTNKTHTEYQEYLTEYLNNICNATCRRKMSQPQHSLNFLRDIYSEYKVSKMIDLNKYDACIMIGPDFHIVNKININEVKNVIGKNNKIYTTSFNDFTGVANKFYIASPIVIKKICSRIYNLEEWIKLKTKSIKNPEVFLKYILETYNIKRSVSNMFYIKIRSNGKPNSYIKFIHKLKIWSSLPYNQKIKIYAKKIQTPDYEFYTDKYEVKNYIKNLKIKDL